VEAAAAAGAGLAALGARACADPSLLVYAVLLFPVSAAAQQVGLQ
jgi:hypothetical protein